MPETRFPAPTASPARASAPAATPTDHTAECAVLFVDVVRYSEQPLAVQREIKQRLNTAVRQATVRLAPSERVLLDAGDGVAIAFLGHPEDALFVALGLLRALAAPAEGRPVVVRTGINFGKVSILHDVNGQPSVIGDGINMAQRVMSFANPGQLLVSQAFYQVLVALSEDYASLFSYCGARTDKHVREHEVYELTAALDQIEIELPPYMRAPLVAPQAGPLPLPLERPATPPPRRNGAVWLAAAASLVSLAIAAMALVDHPPAPPVRQEQAAAPAPAEAIVQTPPAKRERPARRLQKAAAARAQQPAPDTVVTQEERDVPTPAALVEEMLASEAPPGSATVAFAIAPWGEVRVDGQSFGASPPLTHLPLPPGEHQIEIDNGVSDPYRTVVRLEPGQALRIQHRFDYPLTEE